MAEKPNAGLSHKAAIEILAPIAERLGRIDELVAMAGRINNMLDHMNNALTETAANLRWVATPPAAPLRHSALHISSSGNGPYHPELSITESFRGPSALPR